MDMTIKYYYRCGICDYYHALEWNGDCREHDARFTADDLDRKHTVAGWEEVEVPE